MSKTIYKILPTFFFLVNTFGASGQILESNQFPIWKYPQQFTFYNEQGNEVIEIANIFRRNRQLKGKAKALKVNGEEFQILRKRSKYRIYNSNKEMVAKIDWSNRVIHFVEEDLIFRRKVKPLKEKEIIVDDEGNQVIVCEPIRGQRKYRISKLRDTSVNTELLMALGFHLFIELEDTTDCIWMW